MLHHVPHISNLIVNYTLHNRNLGVKLIKENLRSKMGILRKNNKNMNYECWREIKKKMTKASSIALNLMQGQIQHPMKTNNAYF